MVLETDTIERDSPHHEQYYFYVDACAIWRCGTWAMASPRKMGD